MGYEENQHILTCTIYEYFIFIYRSIEYVKPILQVLNSAYEKYGHGAIPAGLVNTMRNVNNAHQ